jgi:hypothetical protein
MNDELTTHVRKTLKAYGDEAAAHFGVKKATLDNYIKRGRYPLSLIGKILREQGQDAPSEQAEPRPEPQPPPPPETQPYPQDILYNSGYGLDPKQPYVPPLEAELTATAVRVQQIVDYIQHTIDVYIKQFASRIDLLEKHVAFLRANQMRAAVGAASLTRPDAMAPVEQVFTTNPNAGLAGHPLGNSWDTGVAPTKEMVDAQANRPVIEGIEVRGAELARPATYIPEQPSFGYGWNQPRPPRK